MTEEQIKDGYERLDTALHGPQDAFDRHKGYPTALHLERLQLHGVSPVHRRSYAPVRALLGILS